jgi:hypothetical protein
MNNRVNIKPVEFDWFNYGEFAAIKSQAGLNRPNSHLFKGAAL